VTNWFGDLVSHPKVIVDANSKEEIAAILKDKTKYPSPVRAVGSNHSTAPCGVAEGGTLIRMKMNRILRIDGDSITVEAGARHIDMARELVKHNLQFYVNTEIGSLTAGSAACAGTKDASFPGEYGQVGSYVIGVKLVLPSGDLLEVTEAEPELIQKVRSSYGTFGIVYEVTYRIRPLLPMAVYHETFTLAEFIAKLDELKARGESMMFYHFPFVDRITIEFRKYNPGASGTPNRSAWVLRNYLWGTAGPRFGHDIEANITIPSVRYEVIDGFNAILRFKLENLIRADYTIPPDQIIDYPPVSDDSRYTFSLFAFPEAQFPQTLSEFFKFARDYYDQHGYRSNLLYVGYRIAEDKQSLLSYSYDGPVITIDPVSTGNPGWKPFLEAYNQFCLDRGGKPLLNQTFGLTADIVQKAFGDRLKTFAETRRQYDPEDRLLNDYFRTLLG
ncbi:MAG TPA: FAD-binding protein, partial [Micropepsaceae bacterium]|nr:FAD-binding protein [Micropepsaceae bacterium]